MIFLFPRLDYGIIISHFEKIAFFDFGSYFGCFQPSQKAIFCSKDISENPPTFWKKMKKWKIFCGFFWKTSKLSGSIFWTSWDHMVAQKSHFKKKSRKKSLTQVTPPWLVNCVICRKAKFGQNRDFCDFSDFLDFHENYIYMWYFEWKIIKSV